MHLHSVFMHMHVKMASNPCQNTISSELCASELTLSQLCCAALSTPVRNKLLCFLGGLGSKEFQKKMKLWHPLQLKKLKSWEPFWSFLQKSTANPAHLPKKWAKWAEMAVQFSWQLQTGLHDFDFFQLPLVPIIHLSLFLLSIECPNFSFIINQS